MNPPRSITVFSHQYPGETGPAIQRLIDVACERGIETRFPSGEVEKHGLEERSGCVLGAAADGPSDLAAVFGGDGTILGALRACAQSGAPVFAFNYGAIGFLSTVEREELDSGIERALGGDYEVLGMPALEIEVDGSRLIGVNDISFQRRANNRVAMLEYSVGSEQLGRVRCDGLVAATPVGSTGYNLANGGPVLAWGVEGFVVSFIAPHTLTARALVVAPTDALVVQNASEREAVDVTTDGRPAGELAPGESLAIRFRDDRVLLAQLPGASFYHRFREKFGRLAY
ncbi:MAG: kinase [Thermoleophilaceae bacterium]|nr:kinase [Thermoleophilaceae bacterium]MEA2351318.1 kinase [Thermoleophilaceae bacterium]MEA2389450.1 kinase [Thermoleophilaceae bacterium]